MRMSDVAQLVSTTVTQDSDGYDVVKKRYRDVFVGKKSVTRSEFYTGLQAGIDLSSMFIMRCCDYHGEPMIQYNGVTYKVIRAYTSDDEWIELVCSGKAV